MVAPSHLTVQWLVELFHKFNHLFTLMDSERHESSLDAEPTLNPWARFDLVVTSLELLQRSDSVGKVTVEELVVAAKQFCTEYFATRSEKTKRPFVRR